MSETNTYEGRDLEVTACLDNYYTWILEWFRPHLGGHVVELGAGVGGVSERLLTHVDRLDLIEPSPNLVAELERRFDGDERVTIIPGTLEQRLGEVPSASRDVAVLVNVLEHIEDDRAALADLARILRPGGRLLVFVPALRFLFSDFDRLVGHHRRYRRGELSDKVAATGLEVTVSRYLDILGIAPWWVFCTVGRSTRLDSGLAAAYDRFGVPLTRAIERMLTPPVGKNVLLVARRPESP